MLKKFAEDLKFYREKIGKTLFDIANETRIHISNLERMENGDFNFLPQPYIRAFLRQYIKCLGLDEKEALYSFDLAKSGRYQSKYISEKTADEKIPTELFDKSLVKENLEKKSLQDITESDESNFLLSKPVEIEKAENLSELSRKFKQEEQKKYSSSKKVEMESTAPENDYSGKIALPSKDSISISTSALKTIGIVFVVLLLLVAVYLLVTQVFLTGSGKSKFEIVRQNFDDVVKESERKILGKRSDEEIADSLNKAQLIKDSIKRALNDSITLDIKGINRGVIYITIDSILEKNVDKETFNKDYTGTWKAKKCFYITSANTDTFEAYINGKKLNFKEKTVKLQKITSEGIADQETVKIKKKKPVTTDSSNIKIR